MEKIYNWGIIGPGKIAQKMAAALALVEGARLYAVASKNGERAKAFAAAHHAPVYYNNYEALAADPAVDIVYVATPHTFHHAHVLRCLNGKKAVLCEKPMSVDYASTLEMVTTARQNNVFLMEAMWTRFLPVIEKLQQLVQEGEIGTLKHLQADFGFDATFDPASRLFDLALGGGSLLDVGVYPLMLALLLMGKPDEIKSFSHLSVTGADETTSALLYYKDGRMASILSSVVAQTPITAEITGTAGSILLERPWYKGATLQVRKKDTVTAVHSLPFGDNGFEFQVREVQECIAKGCIESSRYPLDFSLLMSSTVETICKTGGMRYKIQSA